MSPETARLARIMAECGCNVRDIHSTLEISLEQAWLCLAPLIRTDYIWRKRYLQRAYKRRARIRRSTPAIHGYPQAGVTAKNFTPVVYSRRAIVGGSR